MKLYLHIGTEKTGSSYIQTLLANNRSLLSDHHIFFPKAGRRESDMAEGRISPGNAQLLFEYLRDGLGDEALRFLKEKRAEAEKQSCKSVLLSNELLVSSFAIPNTLATFMELAQRAGFDLVTFLLVLRDPVEQALSLYRHRAKSGTAPEIEEWIKHGYTLPETLQSFFEHADEVGVELSVQKYDSGEGYLRNLVQQWIGVQTGFSDPKKRVNPSLSISELLLLKKVQETDTLGVRALYDRFLQMSREQKADEGRLRCYYESVVASHIVKYRKVWQMCNERLEMVKNLEIPGADIEMAKVNLSDKVLIFSESQVEVITRFIKENRGLRYKFWHFKERMRPWLSPVKQSLLKWKKNL
jgi:hypothetical protein